MLGRRDGLWIKRGSCGSLTHIFAPSVDGPVYKTPGKWILSDFAGARETAGMWVATHMTHIRPTSDPHLATVSALLERDLIRPRGKP